MRFKNDDSWDKRYKIDLTILLVFLLTETRATIQMRSM